LQCCKGVKTFFGFFKKGDMDRFVKEYQALPGALLLDVRSEGEYREGHIPNSKNLPLAAIDKIGALAENKDIPLFVYCLSGARSRYAAAALRQMGYTNVTDMGGFSAYSGKVER